MLQIEKSFLNNLYKLQNLIRSAFSRTKNSVFVSNAGSEHLNFEQKCQKRCIKSKNIKLESPLPAQICMVETVSTNFESQFCRDASPKTTAFFGRVNAWFKNWDNGSPRAPSKDETRQTKYTKTSCIYFSRLEFSPSLLNKMQITSLSAWRWSLRAPASFPLEKISNYLGKGCRMERNKRIKALGQLRINCSYLVSPPLA